MKLSVFIIAEFDFNVKRYYTAEDSKKGYIQIANRKGIIEEFPLTSISIGVVEVESGKFNNVLEILLVFVHFLVDLLVDLPFYLHIIVLVC